MQVVAAAAGAAAADIDSGGVVEVKKSAARSPGRGQAAQLSEGPAAAVDGGAGRLVAASPTR